MSKNDLPVEASDKGAVPLSDVIEDKNIPQLKTGTYTFESDAEPAVVSFSTGARETFPQRVENPVEDFLADIVPEVVASPPRIDCPIKHLREGDEDGWVLFINQQLGRRDDSVMFDSLTEQAVFDLQCAADFATAKCDGEVHGETWALILPELSLGAPTSLATVILRKLLGLPGGPFDETVLKALDEADVEPDPDLVVDRDLWSYLIVRAS